MAKKDKPAKIEEKEVKVYPDWFKNEVAIPFKAEAASVFLIHGNVSDLVPDLISDEEEASGSRPYISLRKFLENIFECGNRKIIIFYNIASGISFLRPEMEEKFRRLSGFDGSTGAKPGTNPALTAAKAELAASKSLPREPEACLPLIEKVLKSTKEVGVIISAAHLIAPSSNSAGLLPPNERVNIERLKGWGQDENIRTNGNLVFLTTDQLEKVSSELRSAVGIKNVYFPKPSSEERQEFIQAVIASSEEAKAKLPDDFDLNSFVRATQGMSLLQIWELFLTSEKIDLKDVKEKKKKILSEEYGDILQIVEPTLTLDDIGGMEHVKEFFRYVLKAIREGESRMVPMGTTLMGPPGTGKTAVVEALAAEAGFNFVKMKNVRSMWVGESESNAQRVFYALRSLAPVVVMEDEADLAEASRDAYKGDSGVSERIMKMKMEFLSDPKIRGQVLIISCTNRPDRIDAALKRSGRSDERILLPMPSAKERISIFRVMFNRYKIPRKIAKEDIYLAVRATKGFSGADIEKICLSAYRLAFERDKKAVDGKVLLAAIADFIPSASQRDIDFMTLMGILESSSRRLLPKNIRGIVKGIIERGVVENLDAIVEQIEARNILPTGEGDGKEDDEGTVSMNDKELTNFA